MTQSREASHVEGILQPFIGHLVSPHPVPGLLVDSAPKSSRLRPCREHQNRLPQVPDQLGVIKVMDCLRIIRQKNLWYIGLHRLHIARTAAGKWGSTDQAIVLACQFKVLCGHYVASCSPYSFPQTCGGAPGTGRYRIDSICDSTKSETK